ncbi:hypothetical protein [Candidatus Palauibacter sp.]|uniref:hypothetical protein n=1 Tax=Candidatus Palauibacter sp. TaxID=3101350 RepID=UPI003C6F2ACA
MDESRPPGTRYCTIVSAGAIFINTAVPNTMPQPGDGAIGLRNWASAGRSESQGFDDCDDEDFSSGGR